MTQSERARREQRCQKNVPTACEQFGKRPLSSSHFVEAREAETERLSLGAGADGRNRQVGRRLGPEPDEAFVAVVATAAHLLRARV